MSAGYCELFARVCVFVGIFGVRAGLIVTFCVLVCVIVFWVCVSVSVFVR